MSGDRLNVFVSYSRKDKVWLERVQVHLRPLARDGKLDLWDDTRIRSGQRWRHEIKASLARADVAILLISANFYASDFIADHELPPLLEEATTGKGLVVLGIHVNYSRFDRDPILSEYQTINSPGKPISALSNPRRERIFDDLARRIETLISPIEAASREPKVIGEIPELPSHYVARGADFEAVRGEILDTASTSVAMIGARRGAALVGMGGVGKTTLAAALVREQEVREAFPDGIVWLTLGQTPDVLALQRRLLAWVAPGSDPPAEVEEGREALDTALKTGRWLIVLDDVWRREHLRAFELTDTPSRVLITTRDYRIAETSGTVTHVVDELTELAARVFLAQAAGLEEPDLPPEADQVISECGRLPLALALAGGRLAAAPTDQSLWRDVLEALARADHDRLSQDFHYPYPHALAAIQASVDFLPPDDGAAYLQLAIFAEDAPLPMAPLKKLWGITDPMLRNRVKLFIDRALARRQDDHTILLHDLPRDFVRRRCTDIGAAHEALLRSYRPDEASAWADIADNYLLDWLPYHLMGAGRGDECSELLFDLAWLRRKLSARNVDALVADTALCPDDGEVHELGRALRMSAHVLNREKCQLAAQLLGRLTQEDGERTARLLETARHEVPAAVLVPRGGQHLLPPGALLRTLEGNSSGVSGAVVSADGAHALSWSADATFRLFCPL